MSTKLEREFEVAKASGDYGISSEPGVEWLIPNPDCTFYGVDRGYGERPTFVRCLPCGKIIRHSQRAWDTFSMEHGEMCRRWRHCPRCGHDLWVPFKGKNIHYTEPADFPCPNCGNPTSTLTQTKEGTL